jgi:hypothetical protein
MKVGTKVKVTTGRNKGEIGVIKSVTEYSVYVDFGRQILVYEGFGSNAYYPDGYWVLPKFVEVV